jgi:hypothetical protein
LLLWVGGARNISARVGVALAIASFILSKTCVLATIAGLVLAISAVIPA